MQEKQATRILGRSLALELTPEDVIQVFGGISCDKGKSKTQTFVRGEGPDAEVCDD